MYIFAKPYDEKDIEAVQNGEYFRAILLAEAQAKARTEAGQLESQEVSDAELKAFSDNGAGVEKMTEEGISAVDEYEESAEEALLEEEFEEALSESETADEAASVENVDAGKIAAAESAVDQPEADEILSEETAAETEPSITEVENETEADEALLNVDRLADPKGPVLGMILRTHNFINGQRWFFPPTPSAVDTWEVGYNFEVLDDERAIKQYKASLTRRKKLFYELKKVQESSRTGQWRISFLKKMRQMSLEGKKFRAELEKQIGDREKVIWREGSPPSRYGTMKWRSDNNTDKDEKET
jgi:hypothetical protein